MGLGQPQRRRVRANPRRVPRHRSPEAGARAGNHWPRHSHATASSAAGRGARCFKGKLNASPCPLTSRNACRKKDEAHTSARRMMPMSGSRRSPEPDRARTGFDRLQCKEERKNSKANQKASRSRALLPDTKKAQRPEMRNTHPRSLRPIELLRPQSRVIPLRGRSRSRTQPYGSSRAPAA